jgi:hypothetical protein
MTTSQALVVYIVVVVFIFALLIKIGIRAWSSLIISLLVGQIVLNIICPPSQISPWSPDSESLTSAMAIYIVIQIITPVLAILYIFVNGWYDRYRI